MPFGMVSGVGRGMSVLDGVVIVEKKGGSFRGEFGASHCNQQGLRCFVVWKCGNQSSCHLDVEWGRWRDGCISRRESTCPKGRGGFREGV